MCVRTRLSLQVSSGTPRSVAPRCGVLWLGFWLNRFSFGSGSGALRLEAMPTRGGLRCRRRRGHIWLPLIPASAQALGAPPSLFVCCCAESNQAKRFQLPTISLTPAAISRRARRHSSAQRPACFSARLRSMAGTARAATPTAAGAKHAPSISYPALELPLGFLKVSRARRKRAPFRMRQRRGRAVTAAMNEAAEELDIFSGGSELHSPAQPIPPSSATP
jgi:hypothetical protein